MLVHLALARNWWLPHEVVHEACSVTEGTTVGEFLGMVSSEPVAALRNGIPCGPDVALREGDSVSAVLIPGAGAPYVIEAVDILKFLGIFALSYIATKLTAPNLPARKPEDESSPTYAWNGIRTVYRPVGLPYPLAIGKHWTGGYVLQAFVENELGPDRKSWLYLLICPSMGPVRSVGGVVSNSDLLDGADLDGVLINGSPARNFAGITGWVRLGSLQQEVIQEFSAVRQVVDVGLPLDQVTEESGDPLETAWQRAIEVDTVEECERSKLTVRFPRGLYNLTTGELEDETVLFQVRYARADGLGNRISDWATAYDGDDDTFQATAAFQGSFGLDFRLDFFDPDTVSPPQPGLANHLNGSTHSASTSARLAGNPSWSAGARFDGTMLFRGLIYAIRAWNPIASWADWNGSFGDGAMNLQGFLMGCRGDTTIARSFLAVYWGNGGGTVQGTHWDYFEGKAFPTLDELLSRDVPYQLTFTFEHDAFPQSSTPHRLRLWINDALFGEKKTAVTCTCPTVGRLYAGTWVGKQADAAFNSDMDFDELEVWGKVFSADLVAFRHASGSWTVPSYPDPLLIGYWPFGIDDFPTAPDLSGNANDLGWQSFPYPGVVPGWTYIPAFGTVIRSRYLVQVQRTDAVRTGLQIADEAELESLTTITDDALGYPGLALLGLRILASEQLSGTQPDVKIELAGRADLPVWDGRSEDNPTFSRVYSRNPADALALVATDTLEGAGSFYAPRLIDWPAFQAWRSFCNRLVYDQRGTFHSKQLAKVTAASVGLSDFDYPGGLYALTFRLRVRNYDQTMSFRVDSTESAEYPTGNFQAVHALVLGDGSFVVYAPWPDGVPSPTTNPFSSPTAAQTWRLRAQIQCDLVLGDRALRFWGFVGMVCAVGRSIPVRVGDKLSVVYQDKRQPVAVFNASNVDPASFKAKARRRQDQPNVLTAEFADADRRNERSVATRVHPDLAQESSTALRVSDTVEMRGATERHQVKRELDYLLRRARSENLELEFDTLLDAIFLQIGDVALITYPIPRWSVGGTIPQSSSAATLFAIDVAVVLAAATTYFAAVSHRASGQVAYVQVASGAGSYAAGSTIALLAELPFTPALGDLWTIGTELQSTRAFQLSGRSWDPGSHKVKTRWIAYSDEVYPEDNHGVDEDEEDIWEGAPSTGGPSTGDSSREAGLPPALSDEPAEVRVSEHATRDRKGGAQRVDLRVHWTDLGDVRQVDRVLVWAVAPTGSKILLGETQGSRAYAEVPASRLQRGVRYRIAVQPVGIDGTRRGLERCPSAYHTLRALYVPPAAPTAIRAIPAGEGLRIEVDAPEGSAGCAVEVRRGGAFVGRSIAWIPAGGVALPAVLDWASPTAGETIEARLVSPSGVRGPALALPLTYAPPGAVLVGELDYSGGAWVAPGGTLYGVTLTGLQIVGPELHFASGNLGLVGSIAGWEVDLGAPARVHVSWAVSGMQVPSATVADLAGLYLSDPGLLSWTIEGSTDPAHPAYEACTITVEMASSTSSADPGSTWVQIEPGMHYLRSARFRVTIARALPTSDIHLRAFQATLRTFP